MKYIKKYWTHFVSLGFLVTFLLFSILYSYALHNPEFDNINNFYGIIPLLISIFIFTILCWVEIIICMIKISKNKGSAIDYIFAYLFNMFFIPCYYNRYVNKEKNYLVMNIIYLIISVGLFSTTIFFLFK